MENQEIIRILKNGGIGVLATDTLYGLVGGAFNPETVERIFRVRKRRPDKPLIVLINSLKDLELFGISESSVEVKEAQKYWPGKVSIVLPCPDQKFEYIHRGKQTIAFRLPDKPKLSEILKETGPLVAPSVNHEGEPPAHTIAEAKNYFGNEVDFYDDEGLLLSEPSLILKIQGTETTVIRKGSQEPA